MLVPDKANANLGLLRREMAPFTGGSQMARSGAAVISNPDPILRYMSAKGEEEEYRAMERAEPTLRTALEKRSGVTLLSEGFEVQVGGWLRSKEGREVQAVRRGDAAAHPSFSTVLECAWQAIPWGWRPLEIEMDMEWTVEGKPCWGRQGDPRQVSRTLPVRHWSEPRLRRRPVRAGPHLLHLP